MPSVPVAADFRARRYASSSQSMSIRWCSDVQTPLQVLPRLFVYATVAEGPVGGVGKCVPRIPQAGPPSPLPFLECFGRIAQASTPEATDAVSGEGGERIAREHRGGEAGSRDDRRGGMYVGEQDWMRPHGEVHAARAGPGKLRCYPLTEMCPRRAELRGRILRVKGLGAAALRSAFLSGAEWPWDMRSAGLARKTEKFR